jgi:hypothetical protein
MIDGRLKGTLSFTWDELGRGFEAFWRERWEDPPFGSTSGWSWSRSIGFSTPVSPSVPQAVFRQPGSMPRMSYFQYQVQTTDHEAAHAVASVRVAACGAFQSQHALEISNVRIP